MIIPGDRTFVRNTNVRYNPLLMRNFFGYHITDIKLQTNQVITKVILHNEVVTKVNLHNQVRLQNA